MEWAGPGGRGYALLRHPQVYEPSHDTFLLAHAVAAEVRPGERFLEVGCGAGLVAMVAAAAGAQVTATDLNPHAVEVARRNAAQNRLRVDAVAADLMEGLAGPFDLVAFNPPYLPTAPDEYLPGPINLAFDGGPDGNATVLRFARQLAARRPLPRCVLVVHSSLADPEPLEREMARLGYACEVTAQERHFYETLAVRRFRLAS
jgi:release factor glutamine methyltransferase